MTGSPFKPLPMITAKPTGNLVVIQSDTPSLEMELAEIPTAQILPPAISWEQLEQPVDMSDNLIGNRFLERGRGMIWFAPAGVGKSVAAFQSKFYWGAGLPAFHLKPERPLKIVTLQTEDSLNDLRETRAGIMGAANLSEEHRQLIRENCVIIEVPGGGADVLTSYLKQAIHQHKPDIIVLNPLLAFVEGDPTKDLGKLLYGTIDPILKRYKVAMIAIHHTPKTNNRDTSGYNSHDWQYLAAGDARVANWPRAMIGIEHVDGGVYRFRCAKRWTRTGWTWGGKPATERYFKHADDGSIRWIDADPDDIKTAENAGPDFSRILDVLPENDEDPATRAVIRVDAQKKFIFNGKPIGINKLDTWLKAAVDKGLAVRVDIPNDNNRKEAGWKKSKDVKLLS